QVAVPVAPTPVTPPPAQPVTPARPVAQPAAPVPQRPAARPARQRRGGVLGWLMALALVVALASAGVWGYQNPGVLAPLVELVSPQPQPTPMPTVAPLVPRSFGPIVIEAVAPDGADHSTVLAALRAEYERQAKAQFGPQTVVDPNTLPAVIGPID